ncbi:hypothetical protein [Plasmodium yoelii yoelii]|uniref:Uncharacterized protein n=1 Tax=Plasmodium yoelii yoelii TaxID=73239 RepID=Q7RND5_PLAYO|nr:hypothetical protein [Plasmodium yoelii yoelii]
MDLNPNSLKMDKKYINNYNSLEKNYYFMIKEYETITSSRSNIANFRIIKNLKGKTIKQWRIEIFLFFVYE